jgi:taurine dioxygenase
VTHALVRAHPETGDRSLYLDSTTTVGIDYMDTASGLALLDEVYESAIHDEFVYAHRWQVGDLVVWDNGFTMHRRKPFDPGAKRLMKRMTMSLDRHRHVVPDGRLAQSEVGMPI